MLLLLDTSIFHLFVLIARAFLGGSAIRSSGAQVSPTMPPVIKPSDDFRQDDSWEKWAGDGANAFETQEVDDREESSTRSSVPPIRDLGIWPHASEMIGVDTFHSSSPSPAESIPTSSTGPSSEEQPNDSWEDFDLPDYGRRDVSEMEEGKEPYVPHMSVLKLNATSLAPVRDLQERLKRNRNGMSGAYASHSSSFTPIPPLNNTQAEAERVECCNKHLTHPYLKDCSRAAELALVESEMPTFTTLGYTQPYAEWSEGKKRRLGAIAALGLEMIGIDELIQSEMCTSKGEDHTQCCVDIGMTSDCVQLCNGTMTMEILKQQDTGRLTEFAAAMVGPCRGQLYKMYEC